MGLTLESKLFLQLQPDESDMQALRTLQQTLGGAPGIIIVAEEQLHMTVIHIGALYRVAAALNKSVHIDEKLLIKNATDLVNDFESIATTYEHKQIACKISSFERFGPKRKTAVVLCEPTDILQALHRAGLEALKKFLTASGITDTEKFLSEDPNLMNALELTPHITIAKNYNGPDIDIEATLLQLDPMPVVY